MWKVRKSPDLPVNFHSDWKCFCNLWHGGPVVEPNASSSFWALGFTVYCLNLTCWNETESCVEMMYNVSGFTSRSLVSVNIYHSPECNTPTVMIPLLSQTERGSKGKETHTHTHTHTRTRTRMLSLYYEVKNRSWQRIKGLILRTLKKYFSLQVTSGSLAPHSLLTVWEHTVCLYPQLNYWWSHTHLPSDRIRIHCNIIA